MMYIPVSKPFLHKAVYYLLIFNAMVSHKEYQILPKGYIFLGEHTRINCNLHTVILIDLLFLFSIYPLLP